jgi:hypothetical protein
VIGKPRAFAKNLKGYKWHNGKYRQQGRTFTRNLKRKKGHNWTNT